MKRVYGHVDFSELALPETEDRVLRDFENAVKGAATEAVGRALENEEWKLSFPAIWSPESDGCGGSSVTDPLTVYLELPLGGEEGPEYALNLGSALRRSIEDCAEDDSFSYGLALLRDSFRKLADEIDYVLPKD